MWFSSTFTTSLYSKIVIFPTPATMRPWHFVHLGTLGFCSVSRLGVEFAETDSKTLGISVHCATWKYTPHIPTDIPYSAKAWRRGVARLSTLSAKFVGGSSQIISSSWDP